MKNFASIFIASATLGGAAHAQAVFSEFVVGAGFPVQVETIQYDVTDLVGSGDQIVGTLSGTYKGGISGGIEIGMRGVGDKHISISASYDYLQANLHEITANGTINGAPASSAATLGALGLAGADFNNEAHLVLGNIRYDFVGPREGFQPFIEVGGGSAFIEDSNAAAALGATAGLRIPLGLGFYVGARYRYVKVMGYEDQLGIEYKDLNAHIVSAMFGAHM